MEIIYTENPLATKIVLTDTEKELLLTKVKLDRLEDMMWSLYFNFVKRKSDTLYDPEVGIKMLESWVKFQEKDKTEEDEYNSGGYIFDALDDVHVGDCTCFPCSCEKCYLEEKLGINTLPGAHKHMLHQIFSAFKDADDSAIPVGSKINFAIEKLNKPYTMEDTLAEKWWEDHLDRWNVERSDAHKWLLEYGKEHGFV
jgi:hypothetical protein